jgi:copper transport protein
MPDPRVTVRPAVPHRRVTVRPAGPHRRVAVRPPWPHRRVTVRPTGPGRRPDGLHRPRRALWAALAGGVVAALSLGGPLVSPAGAHATLISTSPADDDLVELAPEQVELRFDEGVETVEGGVQVIDPEGGRADRGQVEVSDDDTTLTVPVDDAGEGTYTVAWRVVSRDGHNLSGSFVFHVGTRTGAATLDDADDTFTDAVGGVGRWAGFAGALVLVGTGIVAAFVTAPGAPDRRPKPVGAAVADAPDRPAVASLTSGTDPTGWAGDDSGAGDASDTADLGGIDTATAGQIGGASDVHGHGETGADGLVETNDVRDAWVDGGGGALATAAEVGRRLRLTMAGAALLGLSGVAAALVAQTATATGRSLFDALDVTLDLAFDSRNGTLTVLRGLALLVALLLAALPWTARLPVLAAAGGSVSLVCASLAGHAWTAPARALAVVSDVVHVLTVGVWVGGLLGLLVVLRHVADPGRLVRLFSNASLIAVAAVAVTGTVSGVIQVRSLDALGSTGYGQLLLAKVVGFALLVVLGFYNRQILLPRIEQVLTRLAGSVRVELGVAVVVLALTAALVNQPPARDQGEEAAGPFSTTVTSDDGAATLEATVDPAEVGVNDVHLYFYDQSGTEPLVVTAVEVTAAVGDVPPRRLTVTPVTASHVSVLDASLSSTGRWSFTVTAVSATSAGEPTTFTLEVPL